jgi:hypothetical protein
MNNTFIIPLLIIALTAMMIRALNKRAALREKPMPRPFSREWFRFNAVFFVGIFTIIVGATMYQSWNVQFQLLGIAIMVLGLTIIWWRRIRSQF